MAHDALGRPRRLIGRASGHGGQEATEQLQRPFAASALHLIEERGDFGFGGRGGAQNVEQGCDPTSRSSPLRAGAEVLVRRGGGRRVLAALWRSRSRRRMTSVYARPSEIAV